MRRFDSSLNALSTAFVTGLSNGGRGFANGLTALSRLTADLPVCFVESWAWCCDLIPVAPEQDGTCILWRHIFGGNVCMFVAGRWRRLI